MVKTVGDDHGKPNTCLSRLSEGGDARCRWRVGKNGKDRHQDVNPEEQIGKRAGDRDKGPFADIFLAKRGGPVRLNECRRANHGGFFQLLVLSRLVLQNEVPYKTPHAQSCGLDGLRRRRQTMRQATVHFSHFSGMNFPCVFLLTTFRLSAGCDFE